MQPATKLLPSSVFIETTIPLAVITLDITFKYYFNKQWMPM